MPEPPAARAKRAVAKPKKYNNGLDDASTNTSAETGSTNKRKSDDDDNNNGSSKYTKTTTTTKEDEAENIALFKATFQKTLTNAKVGEVGYTFRKKFGSKFFIGKVVEIRLQAEGGLDQRCVYEDGDGEDLSVADLELLASSDPINNNNNNRTSTSMPVLTFNNKSADEGSIGMNVEGAIKEGLDIALKV